jgi:peptidyl-prolyl cis-trans isomerase D
MLQDIREKAQGWVAWTIVILITIPFALWGINQYFGSGAGVSVLKVNGTELSRGEFQNALQDQRQRLQAMLGKNFRPELLEDNRLRESVIEGLVRQQLLIQDASGQGFRVSDAQLNAQLQAMPEFQSDGKFNKALYESRLYSRGFRPAGFEGRLRSALLTAQVQDGIMATAFATTAEVDRLLRLRKEARDVRFMSIPETRFEPEVTVTDAEIARFYGDNQARFTTPEQVRVEYIDLSVDRLAKGIEPDAGELQRLYQENLDSYRTEEQRHAAHILIEVPQGADEKVDGEAKAKAEDLLKQIRAGADFAKLAKENSQDPGSAAQGGDLGFFGHGIMDKPFEDAAFSMQVGDVVGPVRSAFGYHLIKLLEVKPAAGKSFDEVKEELARTVKRRQAEDRFYDQAEVMANLSFEQPDSLTPAAEAVGVPVQISEWFDRNGGTGIAENPRLVAAAFSEDVLAGGKNSEVLELAPDRYLVLRVKEHRPAAPQALDAVTAQIRAELAAQAAREQARKLGEDLIKRLRAGEAADALAAANKLSWTDKPGLQRDTTGLHADIVNTAFTMPRPKPGAAPEFAGVALSSGEFAVVELTAVHPGDLTTVTAQERQSAREALARGDGRNDYTDYVAELRRQADVVVFRDRL